MGLRNLFRHEPHSRIEMVVSVDDAHVAGVSYDVPVELADRYIARGYATGEFSREFTNEELLALRGNALVVSL